MAMFPKGGTLEEGYAFLPSKKEIDAGKGPGAIGIVPKFIRDREDYKNGYNFLDRWLGWIVGSYPKGNETTPRPPPTPPAAGAGAGGAGGHYPTNEDLGDYPLSEHYGGLIKRMLREKSRYPVVMRDRGEMLAERGSTGYEDTKQIEIAEGLSLRDFADRYFHEEAALDMLGKYRFPGDHEERHNEIIAEGQKRARMFKDYLTAMMN